MPIFIDQNGQRSASLASPVPEPVVRSCRAGELCEPGFPVVAMFHDDRPQRALVAVRPEPEVQVVAAADRVGRHQVKEAQAAEAQHLVPFGDTGSEAQ
ncbi:MULTISPECIES: hypothetical protein [Helcobacillus]|uniref:Uncharacterized protein n=1 Tax=Helcobacillus massiliensis TaxID=521392 RepID=A0A839R121_9MICO|nr:MULTISPECIES: hypothetical protein [Helcobacillus]MBB3023527.1 hypothetical protein [Helcobacillus massiliensis]MCG7427154.1 hypothetical protein [Helcobacillus sp. ACRRO]